MSVGDSFEFYVFSDYANLNVYGGSQQRNSKRSLNNDTSKAEMNSSKPLQKSNKSINKSCEQLSDRLGSPRRRSGRQMYSNSTNSHVCFSIFTFNFISN